MTNTAIFPASFDPITLGHVELIKKSLKLFKKIIIAVGINSQKNYMFNIDTRIQFLNSLYKEDENIIIKQYSSLTVDFCIENNAKYIIRGIRNNNDLIYEMDIAMANKILNPEIETIFFPSEKEHLFISSTKVKELIINKSNLDGFIPKKIIEQISEIKK